ncbi:AMP-binding protein [Nocardia cyriacigeorgica]|uniref:AMP-binding protein n=1 Tax=Nocardia cyriacigeorgica TaxID=135487 RepID=UPI00245469DD|nr:AMP-binding protein [Nocardia cyriacigeorgica]
MAFRGTTPAPLRPVTDAAAALAVLTRRGMIDPRRPADMVRTLRDAAVFGPFVTVLRHGLRRNPARVAIIDERGPLTFEELEQQSNALTHALRAEGLAPGEVMGALCRDHRGMVLTLLAAGKLGVRIVLLNTGFAAPQLAEVARREHIRAIVHDQEFDAVLAQVPGEVSRYLSWVDSPTSPDAPATLDSLIAANPTIPAPKPKRPGGMVILTSGTTGTPKGAPRDKVPPLQSAQFLDRVPLPRENTMVMAAPIFHGTGLSQFTLGWALGNTIVFQQRKFNAERTIAAVATHRAASLVVVPTMLQRILDLGPEVLARYDTSSLRVIFAAGSAVGPGKCPRTPPAVGDVVKKQ